MNAKTVFGLVAGLLLAAGAGWYFASPSYAMVQLKEAAESGDETELEQRIDFSRLREDLKSDLKGQMAAEAAKSENDGLAALGAAFAMAMIDPLIDGFVTPQAMAGMVREGKLARPGESGEAKDEGAEEVDWKIERDGFSRFVARPESRDGEDAPALVFERDGLGWKLVEIDIPSGALGKSQ